MYRDIVRQGRIPFKKAAFTVFFLIFSIIMFTIISNILYNIYKAEFINYLVYIALVWMVWEIIRRQVVEYRYSLIGSDLIFGKVIGKYHAVTLTLKLSELLHVCPIECKAKNLPKADVVYRFDHISCKRQRYCAFFKHEGRICKVIFQPDKTLLELIEQY